MHNLCHIFAPLACHLGRCIFFNAMPQCIAFFYRSLICSYKNIKQQPEELSTQLAFTTVHVVLFA
jgi:hypothetical protein